MALRVHSEGHIREVEGPWAGKMNQFAIFQGFELPSLVAFAEQWAPMALVVCFLSSWYV